MNTKKKNNKGFGKKNIVASLDHSIVCLCVSLDFLFGVVSISPPRQKMIPRQRARSRARLKSLDQVPRSRLELFRNPKPPKIDATIHQKLNGTLPTDPVQ